MLIRKSNNLLKEMTALRHDAKDFDCLLPLRDRLSEYITVLSRAIKFAEDHPDAKRVRVSRVEKQQGHIVFKLGYGSAKLGGK